MNRVDHPSPPQAKFAGASGGMIRPNSLAGWVDDRYAAGASTVDVARPIYFHPIGRSWRVRLHIQEEPAISQCAIRPHVERSDVLATTVVYV